MKEAGTEIRAMSSAKGHSSNVMPFATSEEQSELQQLHYSINQFSALLISLLDLAAAQGKQWRRRELKSPCSNTIQDCFLGTDT